MLTFTIISETLGLHLDIGQMWAFSTIFSVIIFSIFYYHLKNWDKTFLYYGILSIAIIAMFLIAKFGFHSYFPVYVWGLFFNH